MGIDDRDYMRRDPVPRRPAAPVRAPLRLKIKFLLWQLLRFLRGGRGQS
jgi:hypothetical protein